MLPVLVVLPCLSALKPTIVPCFPGDSAIPVRGLHIDDGGRGFRYCLFRRYLEQLGDVDRVNLVLLTDIGDLLFEVLLTLRRRSLVFTHR